VKRRFVLLIIVLVGLSALAILIVPHTQKRLLLRACFSNVAGLRANAPVRIAGVDVGVVSKVEARPTEKACQAAVQFSIVRADEISIPNDAVATIETADVLGGSFVEIDASRAIGPPISSQGMLRTESALDPSSPQIEELLKRLEEAIQNCNGESKTTRHVPGVKTDK
jgi:phospholipid/cholesterol/gamma-HCH transport system substrate-binding protein